MLTAAVDTVLPTFRIYLRSDRPALIQADVRKTSTNASTFGRPCKRETYPVPQLCQVSCGDVHGTSWS